MVMDHHYYLILNPAAGSGYAAKAWPKVVAAMESRGLQYGWVGTQRPGDAIQYAQDAALEGYDPIIAVGGDGTAHEVLNGLMQAQTPGGKHPAMGVIGVGRGNDFAHAIGMPAGVDQAVDAIADNRRLWIDVGHVRSASCPEGQFFGNCVGVGFDAVGTIEASKLPRWGGFLSFLLAVLKTILLYHRGPQIELSFNGSVMTERILMVSVMNGQRLGGGFWMAPDSLPFDGRFEVCLVRQVSRLRILTLLPHFLRGSQQTQPEVAQLSAAKLDIRALEGSLPTQTDGEIISVNDQWLEIKLVPKAIAVITAGLES